MQVEQDTLPISARSSSNEFSHQHSQSLTGSRSYDQNVNIYSETPYPNAYMLFDYNNHNGAQFDYDLRTLNEPPANTCNWSDQYSEPAQHFTEIDDSRSNLTSSYEHRSSGHPSSGFLSRSHESTRRSISHPHDSIHRNSFGSSDNDMLRSTVPNHHEQAPPDIYLHTHVSHVTPPRQTSGRKGDNPNPKVARGGPQRKPSETDQARERRVKKSQGLARKDKNHVEPSFRIAKRTTSRKQALGSKQYPHNGTIAACSLWLSQNSGKIPSEHVMSCLSMCFGSSIKPIRNWFRRNVTVSSEDEDTGYQTMRDLETDITSLYQGNRGCKRKATSIGVRAVTSIQIPRNEDRPYACTSRCPKCFENKAAWERHEEKNRVQRLWVCSFQGCRNKEQRRRVWLNRKEHYINHVSNHHPGLGTTPRDIDNCYVEMKSNFDKRCIIRSCVQTFQSWKERINHIGNHLRGPWHMSDWRDMNEEEKETDGTDASEDKSDESESDDLGSESDSDDSEDGAPGLGPSDSSHDQGADRLGSHLGSSAQRPGSNSQHSRNRGDTSTRPSNHDCMTYGSQADSSVSGISLAEPFPKSGNRFSVSSQARPRLNTQDILTLRHDLCAFVDEPKMKGHEVICVRKRILSRTRIQQRGLHHEVMIMTRLKYPHVVRFFASYQQMNPINYPLGPGADCDLLQYMSAQPSGPGGRSKMQGWFRCLASGLQYLHYSGVRLRDIEPSNMLLRNDRILYSDIGSSNIIPDDDLSESHSADFKERYAAPEVVFGRHRGRAADVWSLGCVFLEMAAFLLKYSLRDGRERAYQGNILFSDPSEQHMEARWSTNTGMEASMPPSGSDISTIQTYCKAMMDPRPEQRPTAAEIARQIPARLCCEEQVDIMTQSKAASGPALTASEPTLTSHSCGEEDISLTALLASTCYTPWPGSRTVLEGMMREEFLRTENDDSALKTAQQHGIKKRRGAIEELEEAVISERTERSKSIPCDGMADVPRAVQLLVNSSDDGTSSHSSCITASPHKMNNQPRLNTGYQGSSAGVSGSLSWFSRIRPYRFPPNDVPPSMMSFQREQSSWQEFLMSNKARTAPKYMAISPMMLELDNIFHRGAKR